LGDLQIKRNALSENPANLESTTLIITGVLKGTSTDQTMDSQVMNDALTNLDTLSPNRNAKTQEVIRDTEGTSSETTLMRLKNVSSKSLQDNDGTNPGDDHPVYIVMVE
jgi:hypothetical protein